MFLYYIMVAHILILVLICIICPLVVYCIIVLVRHWLLVLRIILWDIFVIIGMRLSVSIVS